MAPGRDLLLQVVDLLHLARGNLGAEVLELVGLLGQSTLYLLADLDTLVNVLSDTLEVLGTKTTRSHGGCTNADTTRGKGGLVTGDTVLVASNVDVLEDGLNTSTIQSLRSKINQDHVRVSAVRDKLVTKLLELVLDSLGVLNDLPLVSLEFWGGSLLESNSEGSDGVVVGTTLVTREDGEVDGVLEIVKCLLAGLGISAADTLAEEDHGTTRSAKGLVSGGCNDIGVVERSLDDTGGDQTGDVGHVNDEISADRVSDLTHAGIVDLSAVGRSTGDENLGAEKTSSLLELVVVDDAGLDVHPVGHGLEVCGDGRDLLGRSLVTVTQVTTVREIKAHQSSVDRSKSLVDLQVGRAATQALNVDTPLGRVKVEGLQCTVLAEDLDLVNVLVSTVVPSTGKALGVLVGHGGAESIEHGAGGDVLGGDQDDGFPLTLDLLPL